MTSSRAFRVCVVALLMVMLQSATRAADEDPLEFALAPYISVRPLMAMFQPLASYLQERLKRPVLLVTAPSLREFDERVLARSYELAMTAPQTARLAQKEAGYVPLLRMSNDLYGVFLVPVGNSAHSLKDMIGETFAFPDRFDLVLEFENTLQTACCSSESYPFAIAIGAGKLSCRNAVDYLRTVRALAVDGFVRERHRANSEGQKKKKYS